MIPLLTNRRDLDILISACHDHRDIDELHVSMAVDMLLVSSPLLDTVHYLASWTGDSLLDAFPFLSILFLHIAF